MHHRLAGRSVGRLDGWLAFFSRFAFCPVDDTPFAFSELYRVVERLVVKGREAERIDDFTYTHMPTCTDLHAEVR